MTKPINCQNQTIPAYSGITINITNPTLNPPAMNQMCPPNCPAHNHLPQNINIGQENSAASKMSNPEQFGMTPPNKQISTVDSATASQTEDIKTINSSATNPTEDSAQSGATTPQDGIPQAYPPQYYLNNYNYIQNGEKGTPATALTKPTTTTTPQGYNSSDADNTATNAAEEDMSSSQEIIDGLNARVAEQKELEKNGKQTKVVALTNEYIMSLENYLNNPNTEIRLMAAKEILTRLDEDKNRYDDAALNALLNKMLQDPEKLVRIAALSAFSSQLASGNDYTIQLLTKIQNNPNADKEDVLQAADSLLKMSSRTEIRYTPQQNNYVIQPQAEQ